MRGWTICVGAVTGLELVTASEGGKEFIFLINLALTERGASAKNSLVLRGAGKR